MYLAVDATIAAGFPVRRFVVEGKDITALDGLTQGLAFCKPGTAGCVDFS
jgi:hypothetical protein